jgi:hypothetical protein
MKTSGVQMTKFITLLLFLSPGWVMAHLEHQKNFEAQPSRERLTFTRGCFTEITKLGCRHPREDVDMFKLCLHQKQEMIRPQCRTFFSRLYNSSKNKDDKFSSESFGET